jgi:hypothetical protein
MNRSQRSLLLVCLTLLFIGIRPPKASAQAACSAAWNATTAYNGGQTASYSNLTILPFLKEGDSYRTQRVPRWVPAAGPIRAGLTSQAIRASPALGYRTNLVFQCKNLVIVPAKTV